MPRHDIPPPANWEDFEDLCLDLWRLLWDDAKARKHGRRGQPQAGVDVYGQPKGGPDWEGVQCKLKSQILGKKLTRREIEDEVAKARTFEPSLSAFTVATTAPRDAEVEKVIREFSDTQQEAGSFRVSVAFWEDILEEIERLEGDHPDLLIRHVRAWKRLERRAARGLSGVPKLPPHYLERPEYLEPLKWAVLDQITDTLGITGKGMVGVQGMGGIGKTVLAAAVARDEDVRDSFADGVLWVTVGQTPDLVALQVELAEVAGHPEPVFASVREGKRELERLFEDRQILLVADDVWTVEAAAAFNVVGATGRLVITTRNSDVITGLGAKEHRLDVLEPEQALAFLADWSGQDVGELPEVAARVATACGYLPLALAMIGAMVQHRPTGWDDALVRLERADLEKIRRDFPDYPYPDLLRALEASVKALEPEDRERYLELAVFQEDETIPEAALATLWSAAELNEFDARDVAHRLADRSLALVADDGRLHLHDLLRDYVRKQAAGSLTVLHQRLLDAYERRCEEGWASGPKDGYYFQRLPYHLVQARRSGELRALLLDIRWLQAKLDAAGITALIADYDLLLEQEELRPVQGALRLAAPAVVQHPQQLAGQLLGRLRPNPESPEMDERLRGAIRRGVEHAMRYSASHVTLLPRIATLTPPGGPLVTTLAGHTGAVLALAVLADGRVVSASSDTTLLVWDLEAGAGVATLEGHTSAVNAVAALADGRVVSGSSDKTLRVWNLETGVTVAILEGHTGSVNSVAALADGRVVSASSDETLRVWDPETGVTVANLKHRGHAVNSVAALADGRVISASQFYFGSLRVWDLERGEALAALEGRSGRVRAVAALANGHVISASDDKTLRVWDLERGEAIATLEGHTGPVRAVATLTDGSVVSASDDKTLRVWDLETGATRAILEGHTDWVRSVAALADGRVVSASNDKTLRVWELETGAAVASLEGHTGWVRSVAALADGRVVSASDDQTLRVWELETGALVATLKGHTGWVRAVAALADGRVVSASNDKTLRVWDLETGAAVATLEGHTDWVRAVTTLADGRVVSASDDKTLRVWELETGSAVATLEGHTGWVNAVAALTDGRVVSASSDRTLRVWELETGTAVTTLKGHTDWVMAVATLADGRVVSGSSDNTLRVWEVETGAAVGTLEGHTGAVLAVAALVDGRVVSSSSDMTLRVWDVLSGRMLACFTLEDWPLTVTFDPSGVIIAGDRSGRVHFFDLVG